MTAVENEPRIRGAKIVLRPKRLSDAADDYAWRSDEELARFDAAPPLRMAFADYLAAFSQEMRYRSPYHHSYAIEDGAGRHIGNIMYYNYDSQRGEAELGVSIGDRRYWGKGYGTDAVVTFVKYLFIKLPLERVFLNTLDWNERAQRAFRKAGFVPCGRMHRDGHTFITMEVRKSWLDEELRDKPPVIEPEAS